MSSQSLDLEREDVELIVLNGNNTSKNVDVHDEDTGEAAHAHAHLDELLLVPPPQARHWLYATHAVAQFSEVAWQFSLSFFLSALTNYESLFWLASYGVSMGAAVSVGTPLVGTWIDTTPLDRWQIVQRILFIETICVALASVAVVLLLSAETIHLWIMILLNIFGALAQVCDQALIVVFERDWVVEMSRKDETWLATTNVCMRQIDLFAKVLAPALTATVILPLLVLKNNEDNDDWTRAACVIGLVNIIALILQYVGSSAIYRLVPVLSQTRVMSEAHPDDDTISSRGYLYGFKAYLSLPASGAGLALAVLYLNGLTFGNGILSAHLLHRELSVEHIGLLRGLAAIVSLAGTWVFYWSPVTLRWTALWSILYEFACLLVAALSLVSSNDALSLSLLIGGVLASRPGLWAFDLSVTQLQQETVPDQVRGVVGGVQQSLNAVFRLLCFALGLAFPENFTPYVLAAFGSVGLAVGFYLCGFRSLR